MLDFGWSELVLIIVLAIVLMGPRDIPHVIYQAGRFVRRLQYMKFALSQQFDSFMQQADLQELRKGAGLGTSLKDPLGVGDVRHAMTAPPVSSSAASADRAVSSVPQDIIESEDEEAFLIGLSPKTKQAPLSGKDHDNTPS